TTPVFRNPLNQLVPVLIKRGIGHHKLDIPQLAQLKHGLLTTLGMNIRNQHLVTLLQVLLGQRLAQSRRPTSNQHTLTHNSLLTSAPPSRRSINPHSASARHGNQRCAAWFSSCNVDSRGAMRRLPTESDTHAARMNKPRSCKTSNSTLARCCKRCHGISE